MRLGVDWRYSVDPLLAASVPCKALVGNERHCWVLLGVAESITLRLLSTGSTSSAFVATVQEACHGTRSWTRCLSVLPTWAVGVIGSAAIVVAVVALAGAVYKGRLKLQVCSVLVWCW